MRKKVGYLGPKGTYSELAAIELSGDADHGLHAPRGISVVVRKKNQSFVHTGKYSKNPANIGLFPEMAPLFFDGNFFIFDEIS